MSPATKAIIYILLLPFALLAFDFILVQVEMYDLAHANHQYLLRACRELIAKRDTYKNIGGESRGSHPEVVVLDQRVAPFGQDIPEIVRRMNPEIFIREDSVLLTLPRPAFCRIGIIGIKEGAEQYGTFKYIDGLWFWNGTDNTKTNGKPVAVAQAMSAFASNGPLLNVAQKAGLTLAFAGCVRWLLSYLFFAIRAFKVSWLWGFSMLLAGVFLIPLFECYRNEEAKLPYSCLLLSFASMIVGVAAVIAARS